MRHLCENINKFSLEDHFEVELNPIHRKLGQIEVELDILFHFSFFFIFFSFFFHFFKFKKKILFFHFSLLRKCFPKSTIFFVMMVWCSKITRELIEISRWQRTNTWGEFWHGSKSQKSFLFSHAINMSSFEMKRKEISVNVLWNFCRCRLRRLIVDKFWELFNNFCQ